MVTGAVAGPFVIPGSMVTRAGAAARSVLTRIETRAMV